MTATPPAWASHCTLRRRSARVGRLGDAVDAFGRARAMAASLPPATAAFSVAVGVLSLLCLTAREAFLLFALTPGNTILGKLQFWNLLTGSFVETSVVKVRAAGTPHRASSSSRAALAAWPCVCVSLWRVWARADSRAREPLMCYPQPPATPPPPHPPRAVQLGLQVALLVFVGSKAEQGGNGMLTRRLAAGALVGTVGAGLALTLFYLLAYMFSPFPEQAGNDRMLFDNTFHGTGPLLGAFAVCAVQLLGDRPLVPGAGDGLSYALLPGAVVAMAVVAQEAFGASRDVGLTLVSVVATWAYLRWWHNYGGGAVGDTRDEFEFLALFPAPLRCVGGWPRGRGWRGGGGGKAFPHAQAQVQAA